MWNMTRRAEVPSPIEMRWPALVSLDETPGPDAVLDVLDRVSARLGLSDEQRSIVSPDGSTPLVLARLVEALGDLWSAGAVEMTDSGEVSITDEGRRMTEEEVTALAQAPDGDRESNTEPNEKPSLWDYVRAFFDSLPGPSSSV
jgi:restriction endonuclease Mrr